MRIKERRRGKHDAPLPGVVVFAMMFLDGDDMGEEEYRKELKNTIRKEVNSKDKDWMDPGPFHVYDDRVWEIIHEVLEEN